MATPTAASSQPAQGAQSPRIVALVTDKTRLTVATKFGDVSTFRINQAGDAAFTAGGSSALFFRRNNASAPTRVLQMGDVLPGLPRTQVDGISNVYINNSGLIAFLPWYSTLGTRYAIYTFDGTTFRKVVTGDDPAPGTGGASVGGMALIGLTNTGDVAFLGDLYTYPGGFDHSTLFLAPASGGLLRLVGNGDNVPGVGTIDRLWPFGMNNAGEVLFYARINGDDANWAYLVVNRSGAVRVPQSGMPGPDNRALINDAGAVAFQNGNSIWIHTPGAPAVQIAGGDWPSPKFPGHEGEDPVFLGLYLRAFNAAGQIAFHAGLNNSTVGQALYRYTPPTLVDPAHYDIVAYHTEGELPGLPGLFINNIGAGSVSMNNGGAVSFRAGLGGGSIARAVFRWGGGSLTKVVAEGDSTGLSGGGTYGLGRGGTTVMLDNGYVHFLADVLSGTAYSGAFLWTGGTTKVLTSSADNLPSGSRLTLRTAFPSIAGNYVAFRAFRTGGQESLWVHNIATGTDTKIAADGDTAPSTGGRLRIAANARFINRSGRVVFQARVVGGSAYAGNGIFTALPGGPLTKIVAQGDVYSAVGDPRSGQTFSGITLNGILPVPLNDAGQVAFRAYLDVAGVFVASANVSPVKVAMSYDPAPSTTGVFDDLTWTAMGPEINRLGQTLFQAPVYYNVGGVESWGDGYFVGMAGGTPDKVVASGDPGPLGSTFSDFFQHADDWGGAAFNDNGEVAFISQLNGWPNGGVFVGHPQLPTPTTVVLNHDPAPVLGDYAITLPSMETDLNSRSDLVFRVALSGGDAGSGVFLRRGGTDEVLPVMVEGQNVPGSKAKFLPALPYLYGYPGENLNMAPAGDVLFVGQFLDGGPFRYGLFRFAPDNTLSKLFAVGDPASGTGGSLSDIFLLVSASETGRVAFWGRVSGGNVTEGIFITK